MPIADPEHTIVMKLVYGSEQDVEDALGIYVRQRKRLGLRRIRQFASRQGVLDDLRDLERKSVEIKAGARGSLEREIGRARKQIRSGKTVSPEEVATRGRLRGHNSF